MIKKLDNMRALPNQNTAEVPTADIQESLKILQFRYGRKVGFRPVVRRGVRFYSVEKRLYPESEIVSWIESGDRCGTASPLPGTGILAPSDRRPPDLGARKRPRAREHRLHDRTA
jgi:hypothetical protein